MVNDAIGRVGNWTLEVEIQWYQGYAIWLEANTEQHVQVAQEHK